MTDGGDLYHEVWLPFQWSVEAGKICEGLVGPTLVLNLTGASGYTLTEYYATVSEKETPNRVWPKCTT